MTSSSSSSGSGSGSSSSRSRSNEVRQRTSQSSSGSSSIRRTRRGATPVAVVGASSSPSSSPSSSSSLSWAAVGLFVSAVLGIVFGAGDPRARAFWKGLFGRGRREVGPGGWLLDRGAEGLVGPEYVSGCDVDVVERGDWGDLAALTRTIQRDYIDAGRPVLIKGAADSWPARRDQRWSRDLLIENYGTVSTNVGPGVGVVYTGGGETRESSLASQLDAMRMERAGDVSFDVEFFKRVPELLADFSPPRMFHSFFTRDSILSGDSWLIFSLGGSLSGLPFHVHGATWLGLVYGMKHWFLYEPGRSPPSDVESRQGWHPLKSTLDWLRTVLPAIQDQKKMRPLRCTQHAGDVMYLPANWKHATLNLGETIAAGGQVAYTATQRRLDCERVLERSPDDVEALHGLGIALAHLGMSALEKEEKEKSDRANVGGAVVKHSGDDGSGSARELLQKSVDSFVRALELRPDQPELYILLAEVYVQLGDLHSAKGVSEKLAGHFRRDSVSLEVPDSSLAAIHLSIARWLNSMEMYSETQVLMENLSLRQDDCPEALLEYGRALLYQRDWTKLKDVLDRLGSTILGDYARNYHDYLQQAYQEREKYIEVEDGKAS